MKSVFKKVEMADLGDLEKRMRALARVIVEDSEKITRSAATVALDLIQERTKTGVDAKGKFYPPYSIKPLSRKKWPNLPSTQSGSAKFQTAEKLAEEKGGLFSYYDWREENLGTAKATRRDFRFTGRMMNSLKVYTRKTRKGINAVIEPSTQELRDRLERNQKILNRKGGQKILELSKNELSLISEIQGEEFLRLLKEKL